MGNGSRAKVTPLAPRRFGLEFAIGQETHDKLRHVQALLGHQIPSGDVAEVFDRALYAQFEIMFSLLWTAAVSRRVGSVLLNITPWLHGLQPREDVR